MDFEHVNAGNFSLFHVMLADNINWCSYTIVR